MQGSQSLFTPWLLWQLEYLPFQQVFLASALPARTQPGTQFITCNTVLKET